MASGAARACARCHKKKVKCTGFPGCRNCDASNTACEPYLRPRKGHILQSLKQAEERIQWLEGIVSRDLGVNCSLVPTGTPIEPRTSRRSNMSVTGTQGPPHIVDTISPVASTAVQPSPNDASDISILAFNATGEQRYLGPSSGSFFTSYAASILRSCAPSASAGSTDGTRAVREPLANMVDAQPPLELDMIKLFQRSYEMWISPLYPLLSSRQLDDLVSRCARSQEADSAAFSRSDEDPSELTLFYLIMALGATNRIQTMKQLHRQGISHSFWENLGASPSPVSLYGKAMKYFDPLARDLRPSVSMVQTLLLVCIYSSHGTIGLGQWQIAGLAMRSAVEIGLHYSTPSSNVEHEDSDQRSRAFWTAYAIEITLSYNLGRPPSISDEHVTAKLPIFSTETSPGIHHIRHRRIQSRLISRVYCGTSQIECRSDSERQDLILRIQGELDEWKTCVGTLCPPNDMSPYPRSYWERLYHGTTFVLHRASPLCPSPSASSSERCIRSAGAYIDNMSDILKTSNVPISWMLIQGILFAGLTMLITSRTSFARIDRRTALLLLLVDFPAWTRKCSVCLAIMNERWDDDLLFKLATQFEALADNTLRIISKELTSEATEKPVDAIHTTDQAGTDVWHNHENTEGSVENPSSLFGGQSLEFGEDFGSFAELFGTSGMQTFWDFFPQDLHMDDSGQFNYLNPETEIDPAAATSRW